MLHDFITNARRCKEGNLTVTQADSALRELARLAWSDMSRTDISNAIARALDEVYGCHV